MNNSDTRTLQHGDLVICTDAKGERLSGIVLHVFRAGQLLVDVGKRGTREWLPDARLFDADKVKRA